MIKRLIGKSKIVVFSIIFLIVLFQFVSANPTLAPLNPDFLKYQQDLKAGKLKKQTKEGYTFGYIPPPVDLSHLKGQKIVKAYPPLGYPTFYDLRTQGKLTPVKNQGTCGSCWTFATYGSLESCLLPSENWDFSENNLKNTHGFDWGCCEGGNSFMSTAYLVRWDGPISETDDPYNAASCISPGGLTPKKHIQEVLIFPSRGSPLDNDNIKWAIMTYGAVDTSIYYDDAYYNPDTYAYYYNGSSSSNHDVAIVGWDDNFDKNKFSITPPGNGAFIVRNSWGTGWGENGYFYVSYYDTKIGDDVSFNNGELTTNYNRIYQYDPLGWVDSVGYSSNTAWFANIFTATSDNLLSAVGFYTSSLNSSYEIYIYNNVSSGPRSGTLVGSKTGIIPIPGYHTIPLDSDIPLTSGQKFSVVVKLITPGNNYPIPVEYPLTGYSSQATANPGESYISSNGNLWIDTTIWEADTNVCLKAYTGNITLPSAPTNLTATAGDTKVDLSWTASQKGTYDIAGYNVYHSKTSGSGYTKINTQIITGTNYNNTNLNPGETYYYVVRAVDTEGNESESSNEAGATTTGEVIAAIQTSANTWEIKSIILTTSDNSISKIYKNIKVYVYRWNPKLDKYEKLDKINPWEGYWIYSKTAETINITGRLSDQTKDKKIQLYKGWNQIASAFAFDVLWSDCKVEKNGQIENIGSTNANKWVSRYIYWYINNNYSYANETSNMRIEPWSGYWIRAREDCYLIIPAKPAPPTKTKEIYTYPEGTILKISAQAGEYRDTYNFIGIKENASDGYDIYDVEKPPTSPSLSVEVYFLDSETKERYSSDFRKDNLEWEMVVKSNNLLNIPVNLIFEELQEIPAGYYFQITDEVTGGKIDLRKEKNYTFTPGADGLRKFKIKLIKEGEIEEETSTTSLSCYAYPNPYSGNIAGISSSKQKYTSSGITFRYKTGGNIQEVVIEIFNITGKLLDKFYGELDGDTVWWKVNQLANGIYIYRITVFDGVKKFSKTGKIVILK